MSFEHGGPDASGVPAWDFSTNANACGPAPSTLAALRAADPTRYPDPAGQRLREALAALHGVAPARVVLAASASEFIQRLSSVIALAQPGAAVQLPPLAYGDYRRAALACGLRAASAVASAVTPAVTSAIGATLPPPRLLWHTEPGSPLGQAEPVPEAGPGTLRVIDRAYAPLRLEGEAPPLPAQAWQLWSPNKALGLTGVRGAYAIAPAGGACAATAPPADLWPDAAAVPFTTAWLLARLQALAPSWPLGAHGVAMLQSWAEPATQAWVAESLATLRHWKTRQLGLLAELGWAWQPSVTPFFVARWAAAVPAAELGARLAALRREGLKLRDTTSMGLPGWVRLSVQPPAAQDALVRLWRAVAPTSIERMQR